MEFKYYLNKNYVSRVIVPKKRTNYNLLETPPLEDRFEREKKEKKLENLNKGFKKNQTISKNSQKKIRNAIEWLEYIAKNKVFVSKKGKRFSFKIQMITLTLPVQQKYDDKKTTKEILGYFINNLRNNYDFKNYIWRAETQKNGNIHYHIITDSGIGYWTVLKIWNKCLESHGYITAYRKLTGNNYPNSVDIKRIPKDWKIENYISKYVSKKDSEKNRRVVECRHYSMSYELSRLPDFLRECSDIAEMAVSYTYSKIWSVINEYCAYILIDLRKLNHKIKGLKSEILKRARDTINLNPSNYTYNHQLEIKNQMIITF